MTTLTHLSSAGLIWSRAPLLSGGTRWPAREILKFQRGVQGGNFERSDERWRIRLLNYKTVIDLECFHKCLHNLIRLDLMSWWIRWKSGLPDWGTKLLMPTASHVCAFDYSEEKHRNVESRLSPRLSHQGKQSSGDVCLFTLDNNIYCCKIHNKGQDKLFFMTNLESKIECVWGLSQILFCGKGFSATPWARQKKIF